MVKPKIPSALQIAVYKKYKSEIFHSNGKAKPYSDKIYKTLISELNGMNAKAIQISINRNVSEILVEEQASASTTGEGINFPLEFADVRSHKGDFESNNDDISDNFEASSSLTDEGNYFPPEFVDVSLHEENVESNTEDVTDNLESDSTSECLNHRSLYDLYNKKTAQEEASEEIDVIFHSIAKIDNLFKNSGAEIIKVTEIYRQIGSDFINHRKKSEEAMCALQKQVADRDQRIGSLEEEITELGDANRIGKEGYQKSQDELHALQKESDKAICFLQAQVADRDKRIGSLEEKITELGEENRIGKEGYQKSQDVLHALQKESDKAICFLQAQVADRDKRIGSLEEKITELGEENRIGKEGYQKSQEALYAELTNIQKKSEESVCALQKEVAERNKRIGMLEDKFTELGDSNRIMYEHYQKSQETLHALINQNTDLLTIQKESDEAMCALQKQVADRDKRISTLEEKIAELSEANRKEDSQKSQEAFNPELTNIHKESEIVHIDGEKKTDNIESLTSADTVSKTPLKKSIPNNTAEPKELVRSKFPATQKRRAIQLEQTETQTARAQSTDPPTKISKNTRAGKRAFSLSQGVKTDKDVCYPGNNTRKKEKKVIKATRNRK